MSGGNELGDHQEPVGRVPWYATRQVEADPTSDALAYGDRPAFDGASTGDDWGLSVPDPDKTELPEQAGDVADADVAGSDIGRTSIEEMYFGGQPDNPGPVVGEPGADEAADGLTARDVPAEDATQEVGPDQTHFAWRAMVVELPEHLKATDPPDRDRAWWVVNVERMDRQPDEPEGGQGATDTAETADAGDSDSDSRYNESVAGFMSETFGMDVDRARELVKEAIQSQVDGHVDGPDDADAAHGGSPTSGKDEEVDEHGARPEEDAADDKQGGWRGLIRGATESVGRVARNEREIYREGAGAFGESVKTWWGTRGERGNARALKNFREAVDDGKKDWDKYNRRRGRNGEAPRGQD